MHSVGIGGQRGPAPLPGHVHDMAGQCVEHACRAEQLVHLGRGRRVELAEHNRRVAEHLGEFGPGVRPDRPHLEA